VCLSFVNMKNVSYRCECKAVSDTIHFSFHKWDLLSCKLCGCSDASMTTCEEACRSAVENYAKGGCGKVVKGSIVKYSWEASSCSSGIGDGQYTCA
jgi:hypothetical protein